MEKKKMNFGGREASIPEEIIFEIFSWLPIKSLMCFKCVSRFCNSLVSESCLVDIHRCRSMTRPGGTKYFLHDRKDFYAAEQKEDGNISASPIQIERFDGLYSYSDSLLDCVNGLFCVWAPSSAAIFNPSTKEVKFLPVLSKDSFRPNYSLGFEPKEKKYKVLSTTCHVRQKHWVFTLGIDESWRETQSISPYAPYCKRSVCISGVIYQFVRNPKRAIAAFDVKSEKFKIIALWNASHSVYDYQLIEVKGKLAVIDFGCVRYFDLWILEQTPKTEWKKHIIHYPSIWNDIQRPIVSCTSHDGEIVFTVNFKSGALCSCYDVITKIWRHLGIKGLPEETCIEDIYSYVEVLDRSI